MSIKEFLPFKQARAIVHRLDLRGIEWREYNRPGTPYWGLIPVHPDRAYRGKGWVNWTDWFGNRRPHGRGHWRSFKEARKFARGLGFKKIGEWRKFYKTDKRPQDIPADPSVVYQGEGGWTNWQDFLGYKLARAGWVGRKRAKAKPLTTGGTGMDRGMGKTVDEAKVLKGFLNFSTGGEAAVVVGDETISIHHKKSIQISKRLYQRLGLGKRRYFVELLYSPMEDKVGLKFVTVGGGLRMSLSPTGRTIAGSNFCKRYRIPGKDQTQLPVEVYEKLMIIKAKLRRDGVKGVPHTIPTGPVEGKRTGGRKKRVQRGWTHREPAWPVFQAEVAKVLSQLSNSEAKKGLTTAEVTDVLVARSVVPAATEDNRDRVSAAVSRMRAAGQVSWQFNAAGKREYIWDASFSAVS